MQLLKKVSILLQILLKKYSESREVATHTAIIIAAFSPKKTIEAIVAGVRAIKRSSMTRLTLGLHLEHKGVDTAELFIVFTPFIK